MEKTFLSFEEASTYFQEREYGEVNYETSEIMMEENNMVDIGGTQFEMTPVFLDSIFRLTKLPRGNANILPSENVIADLNTLLKKLNTEVKVRFLDGHANTLFPASNKGIKMPLNHKDFLSLVESKIDCTNAIVQQCDKFLRVIVFYYDLEVSYNEKTYIVGLDIINGESFKSPPITINLIVKNKENQETLLFPVLDKPIKIGPTYDSDKMKDKFDKKFDAINVNRNLIVERLKRMEPFQLNDEIVRIAYSSMKPLPVEAKDSFFAPFFKMNENGKMTSIVDKNFLKDKETSSFIEGLVKLTSDNKEFINIENKYKIDNTLGSFYCEYNSKFNEALLANN